MSSSRLRLLSCASLLVAAVAACSPAPAKQAEGDPAATLPPENASSATASAGSSPDARREAFLARCAQGDLPSLAGEAAAPEVCNTVAARAEKGSQAARVLAGAFGVNGAASGTSLGDIRAKLPQVRWTDEETGGSTIASGKLGDLNAAIIQHNRRQYLSFNWNGPAGDVPVNIADALALNGEKLELLACYAGGSDETGQVWHVTPQSGDPFDVEVFTRVGPSGTALSSHSASVPLDRNRATLDTLKAQDPDWNDCA